VSGNIPNVGFFEEYSKSDKVRIKRTGKVKFLEICIFQCYACTPFQMKTLLMIGFLGGKRRKIPNKSGLVKVMPFLKTVNHRLL